MRYDGNQKALARRDAYPPIKSLAPQQATAARLKAVGAIWIDGGIFLG
jgi:hypothetical protein